MEFSLRLKVLLVVAIPLACQLAFLAVISQKLDSLSAAQLTVQPFVKSMMARDHLLIDQYQKHLLFGVFWATQDPSCPQRIQEVRVDKARVFNEIAELWHDKPQRLKTLATCWQRTQDADNWGLSLMRQPEERKTVSELLNGPWRPFMRVFVKQDQPIAPLRRIFAEDENSKTIAAETIAKNEKSIYFVLILSLVATIIASLSSGLLFSTSISNRLKVVLANIAALIDERSALISITGSDEISKLNTSIILTANKIREAKEFQAQTIAIIADELNKPLTEVDASFRELSDQGFEVLSAKAQKRLEGASHEIGRLEALVSELVNLDVVGRALDIVEIDLTEIVENCLKIVEPIAKNKSINLVQHVPDKAIVFADSDKITQVLINLLSNAIKYSSENATVEVAIEVADSEVQVSVIDHGQDIPKEFHNRIFQRFEQAESGGSVKPASSGLGLAISKEIVQSQGGQMGFRSAVDEGSTFWFALLKSKPAFAENQIPPSKNHVRAWKPTLWKKAILIVALPMLVQLITVVALWTFMKENAQAIATFEKVPRITAIHAELINGIAQAGFNAMLFNVEREKESLQLVKTERKALLDKIAELETITATDKGVDQLTIELIKGIKAYIALDDHLIGAEKNANVSQWYGKTGSNKVENLFINTQGPLQALITQEKDLMVTTAASLEEIKGNIKLSLTLSAVLTFIVAGILGVSMVRSLSQRAHKISATAIRFSDRRELSEPSPGSDELAFVEKQLHESSKKLMELEILRAEVIGITSHELRTPLTSLMALIELMENGIYGETTNTGKSILTKTRLKISELIVLITNLLDLEKMESGKILVSKQPMNMDHVFENVEADAESLAQQKAINLKVNQSSIEINADSSRITQALIALIRSLVERVPTHSDVCLDCKISGDNLVITIDAPHRIAVKGFRNKNRGFARETMAISLARLTATQHGGDLDVTTSSKGRTIAMRLPLAV